MNQKVSARLEELRAELRAGQQMEAELEGRLTALRETMLRIGGAIQVLEEFLGEENSPETENSDASSNKQTGA
jgi:hypothetical protein